MQLVLYWLAVALIRSLQSLPLLWVAWIGRRCGALAYWLDFRHRRTALQNLTQCFGAEKSKAEIRALARENFRRLGENYCSAIKTAAMTWADLTPHVRFVGLERIPKLTETGASQSRIAAIGHFGNFELYARMGECLPGIQGATTYRALKQPLLNRLFQSLRERSGCLFFERRTEAAALKAAMSERPLLLGLLVDQHAGERGVAAPFFGRSCSTTAAPAVLALRYRCPLFTGFCYRVGLGRWEIEVGDEVPTHEGGQPRSLEAITTDINRAFEAAVRRDPANWFWVHNRWKRFRSRALPPQIPAAPDPGEAEQPVSRP
jgi:KDO2-lipid IV(A) lauroyltransferase